MSATKIEWADAVWNPVTGCTKVSEGCAHCYAERMAKRLAGRVGYPADQPFRVTLHPDRLVEPRRWKKSRRVFVCSMGDLFHEHVDQAYIDRVIVEMARAEHHTFLLLTKRPGRMADYFAQPEVLIPRLQMLYDRRVSDAIGRAQNPTGKGCGVMYATIGPAIPLPNLWLGTSVENQAAADERIPHLLRCPAAVRFLSIEPMLGPMQLPFRTVAGGDLPWGNDMSGGIGWVIVGGESGPGARPMHPDWVRSVRDQCQAAGVTFFFKQWGDAKPDVLQVQAWERAGRDFAAKKGGRLLDGREWNHRPSEVPQDAPGSEPAATERHGSRE